MDGALDVAAKLKERGVMPGVAAIREAVADWACACQEECHGRSLVSSAGR